MTDTHCHLDRLTDPGEGVDSELLAIITIGTEPVRNDVAISHAQTWPNVWAAVGIHPGDARLAESDQAREALTVQARHERVVGIGETGFDTHWDGTTLQEQRAAFDFQAALARELDLPLILHVRDRQGGRTASAAACQALTETGWGRGILHCFNGDAELLRVGLDLGWYVSFAGNVTYPSAKEIQAAAEQVPLERILFETDSPYLTPVPKRGRPNRPAYVRHTAEFVADLRGSSFADLETASDANAARVYGLEQS